MKSITETSKKKTTTHTAWRIFGKTVFGKVITKNRWVHFASRDGILVKCVCGKIANHERVVYTSDSNEVTCPRCIEKLNELNILEE